MKNYLPVLALGLSIVACQNSTEEQDAVPGSITSAFNQDFMLAYRQQATLPAAGAPELSVRVTDIHYAFCPKNAYCFVADFAYPTLDITDAQGQAQQVKLPKNQVRYSPNPLDSTSVRANGKRYIVYFTKWELSGKCDAPQKKDYTVSFRIAKPAATTAE